MSKAKVEKRAFNAQLRMIDEGERIIEGYGIVFNSESRVLGGWFIEEILPDAATRAIEENPDIKVTLNHNFDALLGRGASKTATFSIDETGVKYRVQVPNTTIGNDTLELVKRGDLTGSSFMFMIAEDGENWEQIEREGVPIWKRTISNILQVVEMGPVTNEAYPDTTVAKRSFENLQETNKKPKPQNQTPLSIYERELELL